MNGTDVSSSSVSSAWNLKILFLLHNGIFFGVERRKKTFVRLSHFEFLSSSSPSRHVNHNTAGKFSSDNATFFLGLKLAEGLTKNWGFHSGSIPEVIKTGIEFDGPGEKHERSMTSRRCVVAEQAEPLRRIINSRSVDGSFFIEDKKYVGYHSFEIEEARPKRRVSKPSLTLVTRSLAQMCSVPSQGS
jgi:hypothetical protein